MKKLPCTNLLNKKFKPNFESGVLYRRSGKVAGTKRADNYITVGIGQDRFYAHRIIWKMYHGTEPEYIDHINGDKSDNRIENLRSVELYQNSQNKKLHSINTSGVSGVWQDADKWRARITYKRKVIDLGIYESKDCAIAARLGAEKALCFHKNHGRKT